MTSATRSNDGAGTVVPPVLCSTTTEPSHVLDQGLVSISVAPPRASSLQSVNIQNHHQLICGGETSTAHDQPHSVFNRPPSRPKLSTIMVLSHVARHYTASS